MSQLLYHSSLPYHTSCTIYHYYPHNSLQIQVQKQILKINEQLTQLYIQQFNQIQFQDEKHEQNYIYINYTLCSFPYKLFDALKSQQEQQQHQQQLFIDLNDNQYDYQPQKTQIYLLNFTSKNLAKIVQLFLQIDLQNIHIPIFYIVTSNTINNIQQIIFTSLSAIYGNFRFNFQLKEKQGVVNVDEQSFTRFYCEQHNLDQCTDVSALYSQIIEKQLKIFNFDNQSENKKKINKILKILSQKHQNLITKFLFYVEQPPEIRNKEKLNFIQKIINLKDWDLCNQILLAVNNQFKPQKSQNQSLLSIFYENSLKQELSNITNKLYKVQCPNMNLILRFNESPLSILMQIIKNQEKINRNKLFEVFYQKVNEKGDFYQNDKERGFEVFKQQLCYLIACGYCKLLRERIVFCQ